MELAGVRLARRIRHKVTYYVMTFNFNQTNVKSPIYIYVYRATAAAITTIITTRIYYY